MSSTWLKAYAVLSTQHRRKAILVLALMITTALFDVVGIVSVVPFLAVLETPEMIETNRILSVVYNIGDFTAPDRFITLLGFVSFTLLISAAVVKGLTIWVLNRFMQNCRMDISGRLLRGYLNQPYAFFLSRHSSKMSNLVLSEVDMLVDSGLMPMAQIIINSIVLSLLVAVLLFVDPVVALAVAGIIGGTYVVIYRVIRQTLTRSGQQRLEATRSRHEIATEAFAGIKPIKILGIEDTYADRFRVPSAIAADSIVINNTLGQFPRIVIEATAFGGIILLALGLASQGGGVLDGGNSILPVLGLYAFAGYRMLPAVQAIYANTSTLRFATPIIRQVSQEIALVQAVPPPVHVAAPLRLERTLVLDAVSFNYDKGRAAGISDIGLTLHRGQSLGIVGTTGAGKTTLVDVILGLLVPSTGQILVDNVAVTAANRRAWQANLGYVPQDIYLTASSIAANIAFGLPSDLIDRARVAEVARMAQIHDFIVTDLPDGYDTLLGERGVNLSGGQRQRIGIARALYRDPDVIVFDEATSALDTTTEAEVMDALVALAGRKTLIIIAHRLTTVERCDLVAQLDRGRLVRCTSRSRARVTHEEAG